MDVEHTPEARQARLGRDQLHAFDLNALASGLRQERDTGEKDRAGTTLVKTAGIRVVLLALAEGARLAEHQAPGPITLQVLKGEIRFEVGEEIVYARAGELLALPVALPHSVEAVRDSFLLLTIAPEVR